MYRRPQIPKQIPLIVRIGLWGIKSRGTALFFVGLSVALAVVLLLLKIWVGGIGFIAGYHYWYSLSWMDQHNGWK